MSKLVTIGLGPPEGSGGGGAFVISSITPALKLLTLHMSNFPTIDGPAADPASYILTSLIGKSATVTGLDISGQDLILTTTEMTNGQTYTLHMPTQGLISTSDDKFEGPFSPSFIGVGASPGINMVRSVTVRKLDVIYSEAMREDDATDPANYQISPPLEIKNIKMITSFWYQLTTSKQTVGQSYNVIVTNVRDIANNPIT